MMTTDQIVERIATASKREILRYNSLFKNTADNWGIVTCGEELVTGITGTESGNVTLDLSGWGFTSVDDYEIFTTVKNNYSAISARTWVEKLSTTSAKIGAITGQGDAVGVYYVIVGKGFGGGSGSGSGTGETPTLDDVLKKGNETDNTARFTGIDSSTEISNSGAYITGIGAEGMRQFSISQDRISAVDNLVGTITPKFVVPFEPSGEDQVSMSDAVKESFMTALGAQSELTAGQGAKIENDVISFNYVTAGKKAVAYSGVATGNQTIDISEMQFSALTDFEVEVRGSVNTYLAANGQGYYRSFPVTIRLTSETATGSSYGTTVSRTTDSFTISVGNITADNFTWGVQSCGLEYTVYYTGEPVSSGGGTVDQIYDATSTNAQSGIAVAEAVADAAYDDTALAARVEVVENQYNTRNYTFADTLLLDVDLPHTMPWDEFSAMGFPQSTYQENTVYNVVTFNSSYDKEYPKIKYFNDSQEGTIKTIRYKLDERQSSASSEETLVVEYDISNQTATITTGGTIGLNKSHIKVYSPRSVYGVSGKVSEDFDLRVLENAATRSEVGDLATLNTTAQDSLVSAVNELKYAVDGLGEPFRVKEWSADNLTATIPPCSQEVNNTNIDKVVYTITGQEAVDYQVVGMIAYQLQDASGNRINAWPVCQFTGGGQSELHVRFMCAGTSSKSAKSIKAWVLLKHR